MNNFKKPNCINVIVVCDYANATGGSEKVAIESAVGLAKSGVNVVFFSAVGPVDPRLEAAGVRVICLNQGDINQGNKISAMLQLLWNRKAQLALRKLLKEYSPDSTVVHAHIWQKALSASIFYEFYKKNYQIAFTMHHYFLACPNGGFFDYQKNTICKIKPLSAKCICKQCDKQNYIIKLYRLVRRFIEEYVCKLPYQIKYYVTISDLGKNVMKSYLPKDAKYFSIDNPFKVVVRERIDVTKNNTYIYIGRLSAEKGVKILAQLANDLDIKIVVIGDGPEKEDMEKISSKIIYSGWVTEDEVNEYISKARAFIFPTLWYEGMPMSILECSAYGVPTILPDTCAATEVVKNEITGLVYKQGDYEGLKQCIIKTMDSQLLDAISQNIYNYFYNKDYSNFRHCQQLVSLYTEMLSDREI